MQDPILLPGERLDEVNEHIRLIQRKNGLTFSTDAFLLSAFCRPQPKARAADFGSGTGVIALLLAARQLNELFARQSLGLGNFVFVVGEN